MQTNKSLRAEYNHIRFLSLACNKAHFNPYSKLYRRLRKRMRRRNLL